MDHEPDTVYISDLPAQKSVRILHTTVRLESNSRDLLPPLPGPMRQETLLSDFHSVVEVPSSGAEDAVIRITDVEGPAALALAQADEDDGSAEPGHLSRGVRFRGPLLRMTDEAADPRYTIFGNEGFLFRYVLALLEERRDIYSFHACAMYDADANHLYVIPGAAGSGKTCLLFLGLEMGLRLFATEMTHFRPGERPVFFKGSLVDNVRVANLKYNYPDLAARLGVDLPRTEDEWAKKIPISLESLQAEPDEIEGPEVSFLFPRIEEGRAQSHVTEVTDRRKLAKRLFDNATQKIGESVLLYESLPMMSLDSPAAARRRLDAMGRLLDTARLGRCVTVLAGPRNCWDGIRGG